ncbi:sensor histidine kinase [Variovorax terrae]|uniref:Histidine kinase n=1 Tax=Variovorax terrae TaxID=2923278 RepID=A0A9X1VT43_9BURK|nr:histidine kinase [Variovorax terrae]MCJ0762450.1 histidine kinase [Variovorax terrae]
MRNAITPLPAALRAIRLDSLDMFRHYLQTLAFSLAISAVLYFTSSPDKPYEVPMVYSLCIGTVSWAIIDFGRHLIAPSAESGWPSGLSGMVLTAFGIVGGFLAGTAAADAWFGWSSWDQSPAQLRTTWVFSLLAGVAVCYYFYTQGRSSYLHGKMQEAERQATEARLKLLETQLEPHMLFNTLANLRALIATDPAAALDMLDRMIAYLRATLGASRTAEHPLAAEFERLRDYLELISVRMGPRLRYTLDLPPELAAQPVPTLLLQPLVENSIKHGLEPKVEGGSVTVRARRQGAWLQLEVADTGVGPGGERPSGGSGFGQTQVRERLAAAYGPSATMEFIAPDDGGTRTLLTFPAKT